VSGTLWLRILLVAGAGAVGAVARWGTAKLAQTWLAQTRFGPAWPIGTLVVNVVGCFVFGLAYELMRHAHGPDSNWRLIWLTGFCGAYTTFSTFAFDVFDLQVERGLFSAAGNIGLHLILGLAALVAGMGLARLY
jgi:CrcB protein